MSCSQIKLTHSVQLQTRLKEQLKQLQSQSPGPGMELEKQLSLAGLLTDAMNRIEELETVCALLSHYVYIIILSLFTTKEEPC